eukprot:Blabericola_migrator_1__5108@NODE_2641_length_2496_cov_433_275010_g809_i1_p1_GENE_NODE_2641_length_2496_cov_433_275010_g809_i1NODE_2641_length_2496_cov_433_275010_g809_i1_p1_ORF_typecomplete_len271_score33_33DUF971/PF06155_12/0_093_NODE_2641_length_2496_cov_433_275010_g809_i1120932
MGHDIIKHFLRRRSGRQAPGVKYPVERLERSSAKDMTEMCLGMRRPRHDTASSPYERTDSFDRPEPRRRAATEDLSSLLESGDSLELTTRTKASSFTRVSLETLPRGELRRRTREAQSAVAPRTGAPSILQYLRARSSVGPCASTPSARIPFAQTTQEASYLARQSSKGSTSPSRKSSRSPKSGHNWDELTLSSDRCQCAQCVAELEARLLRTSDLSRRSLIDSDEEDNPTGTEDPYEFELQYPLDALLGYNMENIYLTKVQRLAAALNY